MALGQLVVRLGLDATDYIQGMSRAEAEAQRMARTIANDIGEGIGKATLAFAALAAGSAAAFKLINDGVESIAGFQDLSEKIGDTAENLYSLKKASDVSGVSMDDVAKASIRLTAALSKTDEDGKGAAQAIKALGLDFQAFKNLSPVEQMDAVAKSLNGFEDGAGKTAVAVALLGKNGADLLPFFNDLADGSERQIRLSNEQIKAANDLSESLASLKSDYGTLKDGLVSQLIPTLLDLVKIFNDSGNEIDAAGKKAAPFAGVMEFIRDEIRKTIATTYEFVGSFKQIGAGLSGFFANVKANLSGDFAAAGRIADETKAKVAAIGKEYAVLANLSRAAGSKQGGSPLSGASFGDVSDVKLPKKKIDTTGLVKESKEKAQPKPKLDRVSEAERYLENLQKQIQSQQELTVLEKVRDDILNGRVKGINSEIEARLIASAIEIDTLKLYSDGIKNASKNEKEANDERKKAAKENAKLLEDEVDRIEKIRESMLTDIQKLQEEQTKLNDLMQKVEVIEQFEILLQKSDELGKKISDLKNPFTEFKKLGVDAATSLVDGLADAIVQGKSLADVFKNVVKQLAAMILKALIFKALEIGLNSVAPGVGSAIFGGGKAVGGGVQQGTSYLVGEKGPELFTPSQSGKIKTNTDTFRPQSATARMGNVYNINSPGVSREEFMAGLNRSQQGAVSDMRENRLRRRA